MPAFAYVARDAAGGLQRGTAEGAGAGAVADQLRRRGWLVIEVRAAGAEGGLPLDPRAWLPVRSVDVELALKQLAVMLRSGVTLLKALQVLPLQARRRAMGLAWEAVAARIQEGAGLADAMAEQRCFTPLVIQLVRVGEQTGNLEQVLRRAAEGLERRRQLKTSVVTAFLYPSIVLLMTIAVVVFMVVSVLPKVRLLLAALGRKLPPLTQALIDISALIQAHLVQGSIFLLAVVTGLVLAYQWPPGRLVLDRLLLLVPLVGRTLRLATTVSLARGLSDLLRSGITLLEALRTVEDLLPNRYLGEQVATVRERVMRGATLAEPLSEGGGFTPMLPAMVSVGEASGSLDEVLDEVAAFHEGELQALVRALSVLIEPVVIVAVGAIVGFVYLAVFMALYAAQGGG